MVTVSNVWDRTTDVLHGRGAMMAGIAAVALFAPAVARSAVTLASTPGSVAFAAGGALVTIVGAIAGLWGQLALIAIATDPATTRRDAVTQATARLPAALAVTIVYALVALVLLIPPIVAVAASGVDLTAMSTSTALPDVGGGTITFVALYILSLAIVGVAVAARLIVLNAVVLNERRGLGAFARAWRLTQGLTWRIVGVLILYGIVVAVAATAAQFVAGAVFGLLLDSASLIAFLAATIGAIVTTILSVVAAAFTAQLYVALTQRGVATVFA